MRAKAGVQTKAVILQSVEPHYKVFRLKDGKIVSAFNKHESRIEYEEGYIYTKGDTDAYGIMIFADQAIAEAYMLRCPGISGNKGTFQLHLVYPVGDVERDYTAGTPNDCYTANAILVGAKVAVAKPKPAEEWKDITNTLTAVNTGYGCFEVKDGNTIVFYSGTHLNLGVVPSMYKVTTDADGAGSGTFKVMKKVS